MSLNLGSRAGQALVHDTVKHAAMCAGHARDVRFEAEYVTEICRMRYAVSAVLLNGEVARARAVLDDIHDQPSALHALACGLALSINRAGNQVARDLAVL